VASRMRADAAYSAAAFWPRLNSMLLRSNVTQPPHGYELFGQLWRGLAHVLNKEMGGKNGILRLPQDPENSPLRHWKHVNYPLSQCLIRETDRRDLAEFFLEDRAARDCPPGRILTVAAEARYAFSKAFAATLDQAIGSETFGAELARALLEIRDQVSIATRSGGNAVTAGRRSRTRLKLTTKRGEHVILLQRLLEDWIDVTRLNSVDWEGGITDDRGDTLWAGADYTMFVEGSDGFVTSKDAIADGSRLRLLCTQDEYGRFSDALVGTDAEEVDLIGDLSNLRCSAIVVQADRDKELLQRLGLASGTRLSLKLEGGLDIGHRRFVYGTHPRVLVENGSGSRVAINGMSVKIDERGRVFAGATPHEVGAYEIVADDVAVRYEIVDLSSGEDSVDGGFVGYALSATPAVMVTEDLSVSAPSEKAVKHLVGVELH